MYKHHRTAVQSVRSLYAGAKINSRAALDGAMVVFWNCCSGKARIVASRIIPNLSRTSFNNLPIIITLIVIVVIVRLIIVSTAAGLVVVWDG